MLPPLNPLHLVAPADPPKKKMSAYNTFMKEELPKYKTKNPGVDHKVKHNTGHKQPYSTRGHPTPKHAELSQGKRETAHPLLFNIEVFRQLSVVKIFSLQRDKKHNMDVLLLLVLTGQS
jgi:hypothetical protein